jgi:hypothetical protein
VHGGRVARPLFKDDARVMSSTKTKFLPYPRCLFSADRSLRAALMCDVFMVSIRVCLLFPSSRRMLITESVHTVMLSPLFIVVIALLHAPCIAHSSPLLLVATVAPIVSPSLFPCSIFFNLIFDFCRVCAYRDAVPPFQRCYWLTACSLYRA